ncbi:hypothetical protein EZV62_008822 [Acer yangbiense]|uniref:KIB1-4 beta-propeller domain-containing protein n=1 Tax=Acer yangbiense TaxID=1000413 RepID=A0A5C7IE16_9ROSI|nr:hypothetical protein EZV62_008822 [Acer yangbiense]
MSQEQPEKKTKRTTRWSDLDFDLLLMIFEKLLDLPDIINVEPSVFHGNLSRKPSYLRFYCSQKPGDSSWTSIKGFQGICNDTIFHKGEFYAVNHRGDLFRINRGNFTAEKLALWPIEFSWLWYCNYLVELDGNLLLVARWLEDTPIT